MDEVEDIRGALKEADHQTWSIYVQLEKDGVRSAAMPLLNLLVAQLEGYRESERVEFVRVLTDVVRTDGASALPVRHPLFVNIVLPVLLSDYDRDEPGSARSLLAFYHLLHGGGLCKQAIGERNLSRRALLDQALQQEPDARDLLEEWLVEVGDWFEYATHEVPAGVLYGNNGATVPECDDLLADVDQFEAHAKALGVVEAHENSMQEWRYYFSGYREYLLRQKEFDSFDQFLNANPFR